MKNILITGSRSFIGKNLKEFLLYKYNILHPTSEELNLLNINDVKKYFKSNNVDFVIHCSNKNGLREQIVSDNLLMFDNLIKCISKQRMIFFSSGAQYNKNRNLHKISEKNFGESIPKDFYGYSKYAITQKILQMNNVLNLTIFGCYGKYELQTRFPTYAITQNLKKKDIVINQNTVFDYLYIDDLCKIIEYFIDNETNEKIINVTPTKSIDLLTIANIVNEISDYKSKIVIKNKKLNYEYTGDNSLLLQEIENFEFTSYKNGIKKLYDFLKIKYD